MRLISGRISLAEISPPLELTKIMYANGGFEGGRGGIEPNPSLIKYFFDQIFFQKPSGAPAQRFNVWLKVEDEDTVALKNV